MGNIVAIVGRPNVGKSTLFNRLTESRSAIVDEQTGVTRDRHYGKAFWNGYEFSVIDTGGYVVNSDDVFEAEIRKQAILAIDEADVIIFVVDVTNGITDMDAAVARILRRTDKNVLLAVNKVDNSARQFDANEFYGLGLGELYNISAINGSGTGDLLDAVTALFIKPTLEEEEEVPKFSIVGRPNVGKSSMINVLIGEDRNIVTPISGTTRDSVHTRYQKFGLDFIMVDTAGLRKKTKVSESVEFYSVMRSIRAIESSDVCMLMLDATRGIESQDMHIFQLIQKNNKGIIILVNKWDLIEKDTASAKEFVEKINEKIAPLVDVPILFVSALTKQRIYKALEEAVEVYKRRSKKIPTSQLNEVMLKEIEANFPPATKGKYIKIKYVTQLPGRYPSFAFFCNLPQYIKEPYKRYLENRLRANFDFTGVPMKIYLRKK